MAQNGKDSEICAKFLWQGEGKVGLFSSYIVTKKGFSA